MPRSNLIASDQNGRVEAPTSQLFESQKNQERLEQLKGEASEQVANAKLEQVQLDLEAESRKTALQTIGRFVIRKQVGEKEAIFGTVTTQEVADIIQENTNLEIDRRGITLPEISKIGFYPAEVKLHPEVTATIEIQVAPL